MILKHHLVHLAAVSIAASLWLAPSVLGQVKKEDRNAALRYATIAYSTHADLFKKTGEADLTAAGFDLDKAPEDFHTAVASIEQDGNETIKQLIEATKLRKCDFEPAWEEGVALLLPHLGKMRSYARLLRVDARRCAMIGDADGAAERLAAMVRLANHAKEDHILISSLVGAAIGVLAITETEAALDAGKLTASAKATVLAAFDSLDQDDPFAMKPAIRGEQRWTLDWVKSNFRGDDAGQKLIATGLLHTTSDNSPPNPVIRVISKMNEAELHAAVDRARPHCDTAIAVWNNPDVVEQLNTLDKKVADGDFGPLASILAPSFTKARSTAEKTHKSIEQIKQRLAPAK